MSEDQPVLEMEVSDAVFVQWMRGNLDRAARHFAVSLTGEPALGWRLRTIGAPCREKVSHRAAGTCTRLE